MSQSTPPSEDFRTPGQLIQSLLAEKGWNQRVLAMVLGVEQPLISGLISGKRAVDARRALALAEVFDVPAERFMDLQLSYDLAQARIVTRPDPTRANRAQLFGQLPVAEMITRGWVMAGDIRDVPKVESGLAAFFGVRSVSEIEFLPHAAKRTIVAGEVSATQLAWLYRVRQIARKMVVPKYSTAAMVDAMTRLRELLASREEARKAPRILAEAGVRLVVVESLTGAKIDGACFWLDDRSPVIGLSLRFDRIDNFWFVLRHECEHVLRGDGRTTMILDVELEKERGGIGGDLDAQELAANRAAAEFCVPQKTLQQFIARKAPIFTERDILAFAKMINVHPGLVAGQLQRSTSRYERFRNHLTKIRDVVLPNVLHDGWGDVAPVELSP
jgi:HTH-type transcriptional regulator/antitoxin HigA